LKFLIRAIRPSLDGDVNQKVGVILLAHNLARTLSPLIGGYFADKYQKFKLIATIGYIAGKNSCFIDARLATPDQRMANFHLSGQIKDFFKSAIRRSFVIEWLWKMANGHGQSLKMVNYESTDSQIQVRAIHFKIGHSLVRTTYGRLLISREMAVNEARSCDRNHFLVGISNLKKVGSIHVFFSVQM